MVALLRSWNHHSGFNVHARGRIHGADRKAIENVARYMSRAALSVERVRYHRAEAVDYIPDVDAYVQDPIYPD